MNIPGGQISLIQVVFLWALLLSPNYFQFPGACALAGGKYIEDCSQFFIPEFGYVKAPLYLFIYFYFLFFLHLFIYLPALGLSCVMRDLQSLLRHAGSLAVACGI